MTTPVDELLVYLESLLVRMQRKASIDLQAGIKKKDDIALEIVKMESVIQHLRDYERMQTTLARYEGMVIDVQISENLERLIAQDGAFGALRELLKQYGAIAKKLTRAESELTRLAKRRVWGDKPDPPRATAKQLTADPFSEVAQDWKTEDDFQKLNF